MAKKKLDLSDFYRNDIGAQDEHKISTKKTHEKYAAYRKTEEVVSELSEKPKRINMAFSDDVYKWIQAESIRLGVGAAHYINAMIRRTTQETVQIFYEARPVKPSKDCIPRRKGKPAQRITIKIDPDVYGILLEGAEKYHQTLTQYANLSLEANLQNAQEEHKINTI